MLSAFLRKTHPRGNTDSPLSDLNSFLTSLGNIYYDDSNHQYENFDIIYML
ncbi:MAG: hypothetical protein UT24_C0023G0011 [Candidatus Woesebacteria bacterium GW2011_GWB1_39_12]|uniref:Uncharacterized protein n=2 Tax=Candidatus Woeseibacteriota TaxID=1752722 RepID=A0A0G0MBH6_9BACT|nr:MAG: hypothetical protein UT23_C0009G0034 [Candidatus Woesebacteria bacterium GW2011_GWA1_39_12]KKQ99867.1 MAG: hypothetical protein UT24_C0023G0011 [Candidatus Woesebacteria bacterium GW2011_GWB1_39_12]